MHVLAVLELLCVLVTVTVQQDVHEKIYLPSGKSGEKCTEDGRHCIVAAKCVDHQCVCPPGQKGNGLIACVNEHDFLCEASLDPNIVAYGGAESPLTLPCQYRLTAFIAPNKAARTGTGFCSFEVFAVMSVTDYGEYYQRGMEVTIGIGDFAKQTFRSLDIKKVGLVDDDIYKYILSTDHTTVSPFGNAIHEVWNGVSVNCYFDPYDNFAVVWVEECGTVIKFRPFNYSSEDPVQRFKPGITIQAPGHATFVKQYSGLPASLCALPYDDPNIYEDLANARKLRSTNVALIYDLLFVGAQQTAGDYQAECTEASHIIKGCLDREEALNLCSRVLSHVRTRRCLLDHYVNLMATFNSCLQYMCLHDDRSCHVFLKYLGNCSRTHKSFREIKCGPSKH